MPEDDLGGRLQATLLDGPVGGGMAHGVTLRPGVVTRVVCP